MPFLNETLIKLGLSFESSVCGDKISILDGHAICIEGHIALKLYSSDSIVVRLKKNSLTILGKNLKINDVNQYELHVTGDIKSVSRE
ncbi:MAG: YabP/YqfC family sporulation protein [Christensenellaceae bacterium]|jgi:sporulation protein YqfC|nr:YabP/YqfC family sporulation protein [Christensenellaceae bacterium]